MVQIGSVGGALFAFVIADRIGRIWATRVLCTFWVVGIAMFMGNNGSLGLIYAGRFIAGLGVGQTPVVGPVYIAEIAPAPIRGLCTCIFTGFVYLGIVLAYFANYGCEINIGDTTHARWLVPTSVHIIFAGLSFILTFLQYESPRFLIKQNQPDKALHNMSRLRHLPPDHPYVTEEIAAISMQHHEEMEATKGTTFWGMIKELLFIPSNLYRFYLAIGAQLMSQWSGAGSITLYAPDLFALMGITGTNESLLVTAVFGIVKLVAAIGCALFLVDVIGRKRSLLIGITLQAIAMIYVAGFLTGVPELGIVDDYELTPNETGPSKGAIFMIYLSGFGWALGWNSMQYLLTAELFPLRIRALATSIAMTAHFANQYGNSRALPNMLLPLSSGGITPSGTFWCFAAVVSTILLLQNHIFHILEYSRIQHFSIRSKANVTIRPLEWVARVLFRGKVARLENIARAGGDFALEVMRKRVKEQDTTTRKDFLTRVLAQRASDKVDISEIQLAAQSWDFIGAGTETTAAVLTSTTYYLLRDRKLLDQVTAEIRAAFPNAAAITNAATEKLELLHRVCLEGLRLPTGAPPILPRLVPQGGDTVDGHFIPGGTPVTIAPMVAALDPANFKDPLEFKPERWLGKGDDILAASQPFSLGARGCAGKA